MAGHSFCSEQTRLKIKSKICWGILSVLFLFCIFLDPKGIHGSDLDANDIMSKVWQRYRDAEDEKERMKITLIYQGGKQVEKELFKWTQFSSDGRDKSVIKFTRPVADKGLGVLILREPEKRDIYWLKKPSLRNIRRLPMGDEDEYFGGIDLTFEDLRQSLGERQKDFLYRLTQSNEDVWVIEALPKKGIVTGYTKRMFWVDRQFVLRKVTYYDGEGSLLKAQRNLDIHISDEGRWRANRIEVENLRLGRTTVIKIVERKINSRVSARIFTRGFLLINRPADFYQNW